MTGLLHAMGRRILKLGSDSHDPWMLAPLHNPQTNLASHAGSMSCNKGLLEIVIWGSCEKTV